MMAAETTANNACTLPAFIRKMALRRHRAAVRAQPIKAADHCNLNANCSESATQLFLPICPIRTSRQVWILVDITSPDLCKGLPFTGCAPWSIARWRRRYGTETKRIIKGV